MSGHHPFPAQQGDLARLLFIRKWEERLNHSLRCRSLNLGKIRNTLRDMVMTRSRRLIYLTLSSLVVLVLTLTVTTCGGGSGSGAPTSPSSSGGAAANAGTVAGTGTCQYSATPTSFALGGPPPNASTISVTATGLSASNQPCTWVAESVSAVDVGPTIWDDPISWISIDGALTSARRCGGWHAAARGRCVWVLWRSVSPENRPVALRWVR